MALRPCPECDREVSARASSCPGCGYPLSPPMEQSPPGGSPAPHDDEAAQPQPRGGRSGRACPKCGSDDTAACSSVYEAGTSDSRSESAHVGAAVASGRLIPAGGLSSTSGRSQTALARRVAPPEKKAAEGHLYGGVGCLAVLGLATLGAVLPGVGDDINPGAGMWVVVGIGVVVGLGLVAQGVEMKKYNDEEWPALHRQWRAEWVCLRCGRTFQPPGHRAR